MVELFGDNTNTNYPTEIKYNEKEKVYDVLARNEWVRDEFPDYIPPMRIYHVTPSVINGTAPNGDGTMYINLDNYYHLWSIDPLKLSPYFVASGDAGHIPRLFRYHYNEWKICPKPFEYGYNIGELKVFEKNLIKSNEKFTPERRIIEPRQEPIPLEEDCGKVKNQE